MKNVLFLVLISLLSNTSLFAQEGKFFTSPIELSVKHREMYIKAESTLNDWDDGAEELELVRNIIGKLEKEQPNFLPIYIEKSRLTIAYGFIGGGNVKASFLMALNILKDVQKKDPNYAKAYVLAGYVYTNLSDLQNAEKSLVIAEKLGSNDPWLHNNWVPILLSQQRYEKALERSIKALMVSESNATALLAAIENIEKVSKHVPGYSGNVDIASLVFESFSDPVKRLRIAERLVNGYSGNRNYLFYAHAIIARQKKESPELVQCDVELADLIMKSGYLRSLDNIDMFDEDSALEAEGVLQPLYGSKKLMMPNVTEKTRDRVFKMLVKLALGRKAHDKADALILSAGNNGVSHKQKLLMKSQLDYAKGKYQSTIDILDELSKTDPAVADSVFLASAYEYLGDQDKLEKFHLKKIERNPESAWILGNYAHFLLFNKGDVSSAIQYGEKALALLEYPLAKNVTGFAYQISAAEKFSIGNKEEAMSLYKRSLEIGVSDSFARKYCRTLCSDIQKVREAYARLDGSVKT